MASGGKQGASEHKQQKEVEDTVDLAIDDPIPTHCCTQSDQSKVSMMATVCTGDMKELCVTPSSRYKCIRTRINVCSSYPPSNEQKSHDAVVTLSDDDRSDVEQWEAGNLDKRENSAIPFCRPKQKERILTSSAPQHHVGANQLLSFMPAPIDHPWILPFAHYSPMDHNVHPSFATEERGDDQGEIGRELMGSHGQKCQICHDGSVQCVLKPCGHVTCRSCSKHFLYQPCPFCGRLVLLADEIC